MRIWQATWDESRGFILWAENRDLESSPNIENNPCHPFACSHKILQDDIDLIEFEADEYTTASILLPTSNNSPLGSPKIPTNSNNRNGEKISLKRWSVPHRRI